MLRREMNTKAGKSHFARGKYFHEFPFQYQSSAEGRFVRCNRLQGKDPVPEQIVFRIKERKHLQSGSGVQSCQKKQRRFACGQGPPVILSLLASELGKFTSPGPKLPDDLIKKTRHQVRDQGRKQ